MKRPIENILLITSGQWRGDCLSAAGHPCVRTPNYDALIADGVYFGRHYSVCAPCGTGRYRIIPAQNTGVLPPLFFDLEDDPAEIRNLVGDERVAGMVLSMAGKMLSWRMANDERELTGVKVSREGIYSR